MELCHKRSAVWQYPLSAEADPGLTYMQRSLSDVRYTLEQPDIHFLEQTFYCLYIVILCIMSRDIKIYMIKPEGKE